MITLAKIWFKPEIGLYLSQKTIALDKESTTGNSQKSISRKLGKSQKEM